MRKQVGNSLSIAIGTCLIGTLSGNSFADAGQNPFIMNDLPGGYMMVGHEGICGEAKCGGAKKTGKETQLSDDPGTTVKKEQGGSDKAGSEVVCGIYKVGSAHQGTTRVKEGVCGGHRPVEMLCGDPR